MFFRSFYTCLVQTMQHILYVCGQDCFECVQVFVARVSMHSYLGVLSQMAGMHSHSLLSTLHLESVFFFTQLNALCIP